MLAVTARRLLRDRWLSANTIQFEERLGARETYRGGSLGRGAGRRGRGRCRCRSRWLCRLCEHRAPPSFRFVSFVVSVVRHLKQHNSFRKSSCVNIRVVLTVVVAVTVNTNNDDLINDRLFFVFYLPSGSGTRHISPDFIFFFATDINDRFTNKQKSKLDKQDRNGYSATD